MLKNTLVLPDGDSKLAAKLLQEAIDDLDVVLMLIFGTDPPAEEGVVRVRDVAGRVDVRSAGPQSLVDDDPVIHLEPSALAELDANSEWTAERFAEALAPYWSEYDAIDIGPEARSAAQLQIQRADQQWQVTQILLDPNADRSWHMRLEVDLDASREAARPVLALLALGD